MCHSDLVATSDQKGALFTKSNINVIMPPPRRTIERTLALFGLLAFASICIRSYFSLYSHEKVVSNIYFDLVSSKCTVELKPSDVYFVLIEVPGEGIDHTNCKLLKGLNRFTGVSTVFSPILLVNLSRNFNGDEFPELGIQSIFQSNHNHNPK